MLAKDLPANSLQPTLFLNYVLSLLLLPAASVMPSFQLLVFSRPSHTHTNIPTNDMSRSRPLSLCKTRKPEQSSLELNHAFLLLLLPLKTPWTATFAGCESPWTLVLYYLPEQNGWCRCRNVVTHETLAENTMICCMITTSWSFFLFLYHTASGCFHLPTFSETSTN